MSKSNYSANEITASTTLRELVAMFPSPPVCKEDHVPTKKALQHMGIKVFTMRIKDAKLTVYNNGFFVYEVNGCSTVQSIHRCLQPILYDYAKLMENDKPGVELKAFFDLPFYIRLIYEGEKRLSTNASRRESRNNFSYDNTSNSIDLKDHDSAFANDLIEEIVRSQLSSELNAALSQLTEKQRAAVQYYYYEGMTQQKIADKLKCSRQTVNEHLRAAFKKLRTHFQADS